MNRIALNILVTQVLFRWHCRALSQLAIKSGNEVCNVKNVIIWGNHSSTQFPDASHATINGKAAPEVSVSLNLDS